MLTIYVFVLMKHGTMFIDANMFYEGTEHIVIEDAAKNCLTNKPGKLCHSLLCHS